MLFNYCLAHYSQNSYLGLIEADELMACRLDSNLWNSLSEDDKKKILIISSLFIDRIGYFDRRRYYGEKLLPTQRLEFPRRISNEMLYYYIGDTDKSDFTTQPLSSIADNGGINYIIDNYLASYKYPDNYFQYGSVMIYEGNAVGEHKPIIFFAGKLGEIVVDSNFYEIVDNTSKYIIIPPLSKKIKEAVIEQTLYILNNYASENDPIAQLSKTFKNIGIDSFSFGSEISISFKRIPHWDEFSPVAKNIMSSFLSPLYVFRGNI